MANQVAAQKLLAVALESEALIFGDFQLKSGRPSPYFMNFGKMVNAKAIATLGELYAETIKTIAPNGALLLGLPYKGISLVAVACAKLADISDADYSYAYLRKEVKQHGEKGDLVGNMPSANQEVILIDDVLTAGTAVTENIAKLKQIDIFPNHLVVGFDRQEIVEKRNVLAKEVLKADYSIDLHSIATVSDLIDFANDEQAAIIKTHLQEYGSKQ